MTEHSLTTEQRSHLTQPKENTMTLSTVTSRGQAEEVTCVSLLTAVKLAADSAGTDPAIAAAALDLAKAYIIIRDGRAS